MSGSVTVMRAWYVLGAIGFALVAVALTRERVHLLSPGLLLQVLVPTVLIAYAASAVLIAARGIADIGTWVLAGVFVPIAAVAGFFVPMVLFSPIASGGLFFLFVVAGSVFAVPVGVVGHLLLRYLIGRGLRPSGANR